MKKKVILTVAAILVIGAVVVYRFIYKGHRDIGSETATFTVTVDGLQQEFIKNDSLANAKYADKTIEIAGKVTSVDADANTIVIDDKLSAALIDTVVLVEKLQKKIKIKGRFVGYDDLLEELKMDQVTIIN